MALLTTGTSTGKGRVDDGPWVRPVTMAEEGPDCLYEERKQKESG